MTDEEMEERLKDERGDGRCEERADFTVWIANECPKDATRTDILMSVARGDHVGAWKRLEKRSQLRVALEEGERSPVVDYSFSDLLDEVNKSGGYR